MRCLEEEEKINDILAYLIVLNDQDVMNKLTDEEKRMGQSNICGCLGRLVGKFQEGGEHEQLLAKLINLREQANGRTYQFYTKDAPWASILKITTERCALELLNYYRGLK